VAALGPVIAVSVVAVALVVAFLAWTYLSAVSDHARGIVPGVIAVAALGLVVAAAFLVRARREGLAFTATALAIACLTVALFRDLYPRVMVSSKPTKLQTPSPDFRANETRDVIPAFAPIEAWSAENSPASRFRCQFRTKDGKEMRTGIRHLAAVIGENNISFANKRVGDRHPQLACQMVVTGARHPQSIILGRAWLITGWGLDGGNGLDAFQHLGHQGRCGNSGCGIAALPRAAGRQPALSDVRWQWIWIFARARRAR